MRTFLAILIAVTFAAMSMRAAAVSAADRPFYSADKLQALCTSRDTLERARCRGYVVGAADAMHGGHAICMPPDIMSEELVELVLTQIAHSDEEAGRPAETEIHKALTDAFPSPPCI